MNHITEEDLIAYQMQESEEAGRIAAHLEVCPECALMAESIAETLRVFSAEPVPLVNIDYAWQRLRGDLPLLAPASTSTSVPNAVPNSRRLWNWFALPIAVSMLLIGVVAVSHRKAPIRSSATAHIAPGPLTMQPRDTDLATHLDSAERLLTEVSHMPGPLDEGTTRQAHELLLSNAVYIRKADDEGDVADAAVLEDLSRTLTTLEHETGGDKKENGWHLRVQMDTHGLLLDLRILQQNDSASTKESQ